jgi:cytosine/adenosine deaminase-related metal-dependent hydrolase
MRILIKNGTVFTGRSLKREDIYIQGGQIKDKGENLKKRYHNCKVIDAQAKVVMPGFICAHHHLYSTFARGMAIPGKPAKNFNEILKKLWWRLDNSLDKHDLYLSALYALAECIRWGVTTIIDHHESQNFQIGSLDVLMNACEYA